MQCPGETVSAVLQERFGRTRFDYAAALTAHWPMQHGVGQQQPRYDCTRPRPLLWKFY